MGADDLGSVPGRGRSFSFRQVQTDYEVQVSTSQRVPEVIPPEAERRKHEPPSMECILLCVIFEKIQFEAVAQQIIRKNYKRHYSVNSRFYLLLVETLHVSAHFLGQLQAYMNINLASELRH